MKIPERVEFCYEAQFDYLLPCGQVGEEVVVNRSLTGDRPVVRMRFRIGHQVTGELLIAAATLCKRVIANRWLDKWTVLRINMNSDLGNTKVVVSEHNENHLPSP